MISKKLYSLAFEFKRKKLWKKLWDSDMFAVKLSNGEIGYISIMGAAGEHFALGLYIGDDGFNSYRKIAESDEFGLSDCELGETDLCQDCLQCSFEDRQWLSEDEYEEVKAYARENSIRLTGKNSYPKFTKYKPDCYPWFLQTKEEQELLCQALSAAIEVSKLLDEDKIAIEEIDFDDDAYTMPLLELKGEKYTLSNVKIPDEKAVEYPEPQLDEVTLARLKKVKKQDIWECRLVRLPEPVQSAPDEMPKLPVMLIVGESKSGIVIPPIPVVDYEENAAEMLNMFADSLLEGNICPKEIQVCDERTYDFVRQFCKDLKIKLAFVDDLPVADEIAEGIIEHLDKNDEFDDDFIDMLDTILANDPKQLLNAPKEILDSFMEMAEAGILPKDTERKLRAVLGLEKKKGGKSSVISLSSGKSYVISVSLGTGCYRHIKISADSTLAMLSEAILDAFEFCNDHAHAFFMDNYVWSQEDCYYIKGLERGYRNTEKYRLNQVGLCEGKKFKYVFDFGDEWTFQCKVLKVLDEVSDFPEVVRSKGEAPEQY